jgi:hypothetical protein
MIIACLGMYWIATGVISLTGGWSEGIRLLAQAGISQTFGAVTVSAAALADVAIGCAVLYRRTALYGLYCGLALSLMYVLTATIILPELWSDPLGPLLKVIPFVLLNLTAIAILPNR